MGMDYLAATYKADQLQPSSFHAASLEIVSSYSHDEEGKPFYTSHLHYLQHVFGIVKECGSVLCEHAVLPASVQ
jgi:hypothetical protein